MGWDIHMVIEWSQDAGKTWQVDDHHNIKTAFEEHQEALTFRNYPMFCAMAGIERGYRKIYYPRGVPDDACLLTRRMIYDTGLHTQSWLTLNELKICYRAVHGKQKGEQQYNTAEPIAFYSQLENSHIVDAWSKCWPNLIKYCQVKLDNYNAESILLTDKSLARCRLVFSFDN